VNLVYCNNKKLINLPSLKNKLYIYNFFEKLSYIKKQKVEVRQNIKNKKKS